MKFFFNRAKRKRALRKLRDLLPRREGRSGDAPPAGSFFCVSDIDLPGQPERVLRTAVPLDGGMNANNSDILEGVDGADLGDGRADTDAILSSVPDGARILFHLGEGLQTVAETRAVVDTLGRLVLDIGGGLSLLHMAALKDKPKVVAWLLKRGHPTELETTHGETPLDQACWLGHLQAAGELIAGGANVSCMTKLGYTPLHRCAHYGHFELAQVLLAAGADVNMRDHENQETPYECALQAGNKHIARLFVR